MDNLNMWTRLPVKESIRMTEDRDKWRKYVHGMANPWIENNKLTFNMQSNIIPTI